MILMKGYDIIIVVVCLLFYKQTNDKIGYDKEK